MVANQNAGPALNHAIAMQTFQEYGSKAMLRLMSFADTTVNNEFRMLNKLKETAEAYRDHGFATEVKALAERIDAVTLEEVAAMEKKKGQEARTSALGFISLLRDIGFTTEDLNEILGTVKIHNENAFLVGKTQAWVELSK